MMNDRVELKNEERTATEVYTRIMGYHRPISCANIGKQAEHRERVYFKESKAQ
jgi:anaerobic ribonucleoside-triphosphate reductase